MAGIAEHGLIPHKNPKTAAPTNSEGGSQGDKLSKGGPNQEGAAPSTGGAPSASVTQTEFSDPRGQNVYCSTAEQTGLSIGKFFNIPQGYSQEQAIEKGGLRGERPEKNKSQTQSSNSNAQPKMNSQKEFFALGQDGTGNFAAVNQETEKTVSIPNSTVSAPVSADPTPKSTPFPFENNPNSSPGQLQANHNIKEDTGRPVPDVLVEIDLEKLPNKWRMAEDGVTIEVEGEIPKVFIPKASGK